MQNIQFAYMQPTGIHATCMNMRLDWQNYFGKKCPLCTWQNSPTDLQTATLIGPLRHLGTDTIQVHPAIFHFPSLLDPRRGFPVAYPGSPPIVALGILRGLLGGWSRESIDTSTTEVTEVKAFAEADKESAPPTTCHHCTASDLFRGSQWLLSQWEQVACGSDSL